MLNGSSNYLGPFDSPESRDRYDRVVARYLTDRAERLPTPSNSDAHTGRLSRWRRVRSHLGGSSECSRTHRITALALPRSSVDS